MEAQNTINLKFPNEKIFEVYGSLDEPNSVISKSQFLLIRHGISNYNAYASQFRKQTLEENPGEDEAAK